MKPLYTALSILTALTIVTVVAFSTQQVYAPRTCAGCAEFQKLTDEFEYKVLNTALRSPEEIPALVDEYSTNVKALFTSPSPSP